MRTSVIAIAGLLLAMAVGCESGPPPPMGDISEGTPPSPPEPARPPDPVTETAKAKGAAAPPVVNTNVRGQAAIERAKQEMAKKKAAEAGEAPTDAAPSDPNVPDEPMPTEPTGDQPPDAEGGEGDQLQEAGVGVGVKGKDYGGPGFITTPIETLFRVEDRIAFEVQIPNTMKIYKAGHDNKGPKTHEEFMKVIIQENGVQLPELPPGNTYWYDAKTEQLMVRTPKPAS